MRILFATIGLLFASAGCAERAPPANELRPFVAVTGLYSVWAMAPPEPVAPQSGCAEGCRCGGTGRERTGGGETTIECRCPASCACKKKKP